MHPRWPDSPPTADRLAPRPAERTGRAMVPAVTRALTLLDRLAARREPMSLARLSTDLALPKSSVHGLCNTLVSFGYLRRQTDGAFLIGPRVLSLAEAFVAGTGVAQEFGALWQDAAAPEETLVLTVLDEAEVVYVGVRNGSRPLGLAFNVGMRLPAHLTASGKAMLAFHPTESVRRLYADGLPPPQFARSSGPGTLTALLKELAITRERGHSIDDESVRAGVYAVGAPVFGAAGMPVAGIAICLNKAEIRPASLKRHRQTVLTAAQALSGRLGGSAPAPERRAAAVRKPKAARPAASAARRPATKGRSA